MKRREFLKASGGAALLGLLGALPASVTPVSAANHASVSKNHRTAREEFIKSQEAERLAGLDFCNTRENARLLHTLVRMRRSSRVLEVGTYYGYSALWMGTALEEQGGGMLTTIELDYLRYLDAYRNMGNFGLNKYVNCIYGDAHSEIPKLKGTFDLIFLDADRDRNEDYLKMLWPKLAPGGLLCVRGAVRFRYMMRLYFDELNAKKDAVTHIVGTIPDTETGDTFSTNEAMAITWRMY